jgi:hypothetical protein
MSELELLKILESKVRAMLIWSWEDDADEDCANDMAAVRQTVDDIDAYRRLESSIRHDHLKPIG